MSVSPGLFSIPPDPVYQTELPQCPHCIYNELLLHLEKLGYFAGAEI